MPEYSSAVGIPTSGELNLNLASDGTGDGMIQGEAYGYSFSDEVTAKYSGSNLTLILEIPEYGYKTIYEGRVSQRNGSLAIEGSYTMESADTAGLMKTTGVWTATAMGAGSSESARDIDTSKAKKDATLSDIAGSWTGSAVYTKIQGFEENIEKLKEEGMPPEGIDMIRELEGSTVDFSLEVEDTGEWSFSLPFLMGEKLEPASYELLTAEDRNMGLLDKYNINPQEGVFSIQNTQTEEGQGNFNLNFDGVIYDNGGLRIDGSISIEINFLGATPITLLVDYSLTEHTPLAQEPLAPAAQIERQPAVIESEGATQPASDPPPVLASDADPTPDDTPTTKTRDNQPAVLYEDAALLEFLQGEWASEVGIDGFSFVMLIHDDMYAATMAYPKREDATLAHWQSREYWDMEPWSWYACSVQGNTIILNSGDGFELKYWVYVLDNDTVWLSFLDVNDPDRAETDYIQLKHVRPRSQLDFNAYLNGRWISAIPFDEESGSYISLNFPGDGACILSVAYNVSGNPDVSQRQMDGWNFEVYRTYDYTSTQDGFMVTHDGKTEEYKVVVTSFAAAHFMLIGTDQDILYYRILE